jgi:ribonuclease BN (tRNA processing enzyme)
MALECQKQTNAGKLVFFHFDPGYDDNKLNVIKDHYKDHENAILAHEGLEIDLFSEL